MLFFISKKKLERLINDKVAERIKWHELCNAHFHPKNIAIGWGAPKDPPQLHSCEVCGCLLGDGIDGKPEARRGIALNDNCVMGQNDYIYYPQYCKVHAPQELTQSQKDHMALGRK